MTEKHIQLEKQHIGNKKKCKNEQEYARNIHVNCVTIIRVTYIVLNRHIVTEKHIQLENQRISNASATKKMQKNAKNRQKYSCILCYYNTSKPYNFK